MLLNISSSNKIVLIAIVIVLLVLLYFFEDIKLLSNNGKLNPSIRRSRSTLDLTHLRLKKSQNSANLSLKEIHRSVGIMTGDVAMHTKIMFYTTSSDYRSRMDRFYYDLIDAAVESTDLDVFVWGPGYENWNTSLSPNENVFNRFGNSLDVVYMSGFPSGILPFNKTLTVIEVGDLNDEDLYRFYPNPDHFNITIGRYLMEPSEAFSFSRLKKKFGDFQMQLFASNPDCAGSLKYFSKSTEKIPNKIIQIGAISDYYPLRTKVNEFINSGQLPGVNVYGHPGYEQNNSESHLPDPLPLNYTIGIMNSFQESGNIQRKMYIKALMESEICIFDSSVQHKLIRKFAESLTAGCIPATDVPYELMLELKDIIIVLDQSMNASVIHEILFRHLNDRESFAKRVAAGEKFAKKELSCESKLNRLMYIIDLYRHGHRGYFSPFGFLSSCKKRYWTREKGTKDGDVVDWSC